MKQFPPNNLKFFRKKAGLSQEQLGEKCVPVISGQHIGKMELRTRSISRDTAMIIAEALNNCTADEILMQTSPYPGNQNKNSINNLLDQNRDNATHIERLGLAARKNMPVYGATRDGTAVDLSKRITSNYPPAELADIDGVTEWIVPDDVNGREARRGDRVIITPYDPPLPDDLVGVSYIDQDGNQLGLIRVLVKETESEIVLSQVYPEKKMRLDKSKVKNALVRKVYDVRKR
jgi:transcriptional regulator with XRE-family HTH domain